MYNIFVIHHTSNMKYKNLKRPSKVEEIREILYKSLMEKEFKPGEPIPSENELSKSFNVGRYTVREAITSLVTEGYLYRVQGKGTIVTKAVERNEFGVIFFNIYDPNDPYFEGIIQGIEEEAKSKDYHLHLYTTRGKSITEEEGLLKNLILSKRLLGLFILSPIRSKDLVFFKKKRIPFVIINNEYPDIDADTILLNHYESAKKATEKLIEEGHRRIGLLTGPFEKKNHIIRSAEYILTGYKDALCSHSIPFDSSLFKEREHLEEEGYSAMKEFFSLRERPTAYLIPSASLTFGAYKFIRKRGVESEIKIVGYFNEKEKLIPPGFLVPLLKMGRTAFKVLEERRKEERKEYRKIKIQLEMIWE